jgi:murein L,D-transpeptidase YcbB/YkuD
MSSYLRIGLASALFAACTFVHVDRAGAASPELADESAVLRDFLESQGSPAFTTDDRGPELWKVVQSFYWHRGYQPAWFREGRPTPGGQALLQAFAAAGREGLSPQRYDPRTLAGPSDVAITYAFLRYASDLAAGSVDPRGAASLWRVSARSFDAAALLDEAARNDAPVRVLESVRPAHPQYAALSDALVRHRRIAADGGWPAVPVAGRKPAARAAHTVALRARLRASGDTLKGFQRRHGLAASGIVDRATLEALNVSVEDRIRQIELNLERWRWQGWSPSGRTILVNVPTYELHAYEDAREALTMRVITGAGDTQTPVFAEEMNQVVFSPHWNVPANILETEVLPAIRRNPRYLASKNMEMVRSESGDVSVRQRPGPRNALGLVKFTFPNPFNVYLHDTPGDALFARPRRALSHGCVRLEKPEALARFVLNGAPEWSDARIAAAMRSGREQFVALPAPVPMRIAYFTAWVDADGTVRFAADVYRHDVAQEGLLQKTQPADSAKVALAAF